MIPARPDSQPRASGHGPIVCAKLGDSVLELRSRTTVDDNHVQRLKLGVWEAGRKITELSISFRTLPAFRTAVNAAIDAALKTRPPSHDGCSPQDAESSNASDTRE